MSNINLSWLSELVPGAEAELKTVVAELEKVYVPKLDGFAVKVEGIVEKDLGITPPTVTTPTTPTPPAATPVVVPPPSGSSDATPGVVPSPTLPDGTVAAPVGDATATPVVTPTSVDNTVPTPPAVSESSAQVLAGLAPDQKAAVKELLNSLLGEDA